MFEAAFANCRSLLICRHYTTVHMGSTSTLHETLLTGGPLDLTLLSFIQQREDNIHPSSCVPSFRACSCAFRCKSSTRGCVEAPSLVCCRRRQRPGFWHLLLESGPSASFQLRRGHTAIQHVPPLCTELVCVKILNQVISCQAKNVHRYSSGLNGSF